MAKLKNRMKNLENTMAQNQIEYENLLNTLKTNLMDNFLNDEEEEIYGNKQNSNKIQRK
jgi:hypothetical protein